MRLIAYMEGQFLALQNGLAIFGVDLTTGKDCDTHNLIT